MRFFDNLTTVISLLITLTAAQGPRKSGSAVVFGQGGTYPRATRLSDGSLLGIYTHFESGNSTLTTVKSTDNGASWSPFGIVTTDLASKKDFGNSYVQQLSSGRVLATFRNHDRVEGTDNQYTFFRITVCSSDDGGKSWKYLSTPASDPGGPNGNWEPFFMIALDGTLELYYSRENSGDDQDSLLRRSTDGGLNWSTAQAISGQDVTARDGMLGVARTSSNSREKVAIFESGVNGHFTVHTVRSPDDGTTWNDRRLVYEAGSASAGAPQIIRVGSRMVASFGTNEDGGVWPQGAMKVMVSTDGARSWNDKTTVHEMPAMWAGMLTLDDSSFLALYETGGTSYAQKMVF